VDDLVASAVAAAYVAPPGLPPDLAHEVEAMRFLSDRALQSAARPSLLPAQRKRLEQLNHLGGERPLTPKEAAEQMALLEAYDRSVLRRARALALLAERGHPLPSIPRRLPRSNGDSADPARPA
jgi:hypothetical protein